MSVKGMSNSQDLSLNDEAVFLPISESSPEFYYSEAERRALESLLSAGPGAFHTKLSLEKLSPFLSQEEVFLIDHWAQDFKHSEVQPEKLEGPVTEGGSVVGRPFSLSYWPQHSDIPAPILELGWPENGDWKGVTRAMVYTSPPTEGAPPIREVVRRLIQGASRLIAVVTDRLTDSMVISDLLNAAARGVPVYIILNRRDLLEHCFLGRLRHQNISVRVLGGNTFCSRDGQVVTGDMKDNFLLVDLQKVLMGSYSLTWTDAHLHRQLVTVLSGQVVEAFDSEFRVLYASSLPVPSEWRAAEQPGPPEGSSLYPEHSDSENPSHFTPDSAGHSVTPPLTDSPLNWVALGVLHWNEGEGLTDNPINQPDHSRERERPGPHPNAHPTFERRAPVGEELSPSEPNLNNPHLRSPTETHNKNSNPSGFRTLDAQASDLQPTQSDTPRAEGPRSNNNPAQRAGALGDGQSAELTHHHKPNAWKKEFTPWYSNHKQEEVQGQRRYISTLHRDPVPAAWPSTGLRQLQSSLEPDTSAAKQLQNARAQVPHTGVSSSLSDILKGVLSRRSSTVAPRLTNTSKSMWDLSLFSTQTDSIEDGSERQASPRISQAQDKDPYSLKVTPAVALMRHRGDESKPAISNPSPRESFLPTLRQKRRSFNFLKEWKKPQ
ncbi:protein FAM83D isoform X2 [Amia ocellicauda]|uniref:protein FAM83D isoform X2 n=1 Tax=Amia ocellicauda TaxID=2972642 RepID=UPI0034645D24